MNVLPFVILPFECSTFYLFFLLIVLPLVILPFVRDPHMNWNFYTIPFILTVNTLHKNLRVIYFSKINSLKISVVISRQILLQRKIFIKIIFLTIKMDCCCNVTAPMNRKCHPLMESCLKSCVQSLKSIDLYCCSVVFSFFMIKYLQYVVT